jgi:hypothetical protein
MSSSHRSVTLLKDCALPDPLHSGNEYYLCTSGFALNLRHSDAQKIEAAANDEMTQVRDESTRLQRLDDLKVAVVSRHNAMAEQFEHVKDCFICSVAFGLTPEPSGEATKAAHLLQRLAKFARGGSLSH